MEEKGYIELTTGETGVAAGCDEALERLVAAAFSFEVEPFPGGESSLRLGVRKGTP